MRWKIFKVQRTTKNISVETAQDNYEKTIGSKVINALRFYQNRKQRSQLRYRFAEQHRAQVLRQRSFVILLWYIKQRREKQSAYDRAKKDRARILMQRNLFKLVQVAAYWRRQTNESDQLMLLGHHELKLKSVFLKWKNQSCCFKPV